MSKKVSISAFAWRYRRYLAYGIAASILVNILDVILPLILKNFIDALGTPDALRMAAVSGGIYLGIALIQCITRYTWRIALNRAGTYSIRDSRSLVARTAITAQEKVDVGWAVSLTTSDTETFGRVFDFGVITVIDAAFSVITVPIILFYLDPTLALETLILLPAVPFVVMRFNDRIHRQYVTAQNSLVPLTRSAEETIAKLRTIRINTAEARFLEKIRVLGRQYCHASRMLITTESNFVPGIEIFIVAGLVTLVAVGGHSVIAGTLTLGTFIAFQRYIERLLWPLQAVALSFTIYKKSSVAASRIDEFSQRGSSTLPIQRDEVLSPHNGSPALDIQDIRLPHITALDSEAGISFKVKPGERLAIVGPVGSGKSLLVLAIAGISHPITGNIEIGGHAWEPGKASGLRGLLAVVPQEVILFGMSVRDNILMGSRDGTHTTEEELWDVLRTCAIKEEIEALPNGLETILGERGWSLSGGQRQRLTLARALLRKPYVLLLDNALSAVDAMTEASILSHLQRTSIAIVCVSHRLSTVQVMDRVIVIEGGAISEEGTPQGLMNTSTGWYRRFVDEQRAERRLESYVEVLG